MNRTCLKCRAIMPAARGRFCTERCRAAWMSAGNARRKREKRLKAKAAVAPGRPGVSARSGRTRRAHHRAGRP